MVAVLNLLNNINFIKDDDIISWNKLFVYNYKCNNNAGQN